MGGHHRGIPGPFHRDRKPGEQDSWQLHDLPPAQLGLAVLLVTSARQAAQPSYSSEPGAGPSSPAPPSTAGSPSKRLLLASWAPSQAWLAALSPSVSLLISPLTVAFCRSILISFSHLLAACTSPPACSCPCNSSALL